MRLGFQHRLLLAFVSILLLSGAAYAEGPSMGGKWESRLVGHLDHDPVEIDGDSTLYLDIGHRTPSTALTTSLKAKGRMTGDQALDIELDQGYVDYYGQDFDLRLGKQRISWGTAMGFNPTDIINPVDISNPTKDKLSVWAIKGEYYWGSILALTGVYVPFFRPAVDVIPQNHHIPVIRPEDEGQWAIKLGAMGVAGMDFSLMYFSGWESMPHLRRRPTGPQGYYRDVEVFGADFATSIGDLGLWLEAAYTSPREGSDYVDWAVGGDYGLPNGPLIAAQYLRRENRGTAHNYIMLGLENDLAVIHSGKVGGIYDLTNGSYMVNPELCLSLSDAVDAFLGWRHVSKVEGAANIVSEMDSELYIELKVSF